MEAKEKIDLLRKQKGWSKSRLARELGIAPTSVYNWYNEINTSPSRQTLDDACLVFNVPISTFYTDVEIENLTQEDIQLLEIFHSIPSEKRKLTLEFLKLLGK